MWMHIVLCVIIVIVLNCDRYVYSIVEPNFVHRVEPTSDIKISKNVTIHRNGYGRFLGLLKLLKDFHRRKHHAYNPYVISRLWRASFEFELNPHPIYRHAFSSNIHFPGQIGVSGAVASNGGGGSNSGLGSNSIDSIFHFGNNEQQSSVTIGGSNQINKGPDERDEIPGDVGQQNHVVNKDAIDSVISVSTTDVDEKSERFLRHAIQPRIDEQSDEEQNINSPSTTTLNVEENTIDPSTTPNVEENTVIPSSTPNVEENESDTQKETTQAITVPQTTVSMEAFTEVATTMRPESSSTIANNEFVPTVPRPSEWQGYYDFGIHKPEFIQNIEFTTDYPSQLVSEDIHYITYKAPFKPSLPDFTSSYSSDFFIPLRYFKQ